MSAVTAAGALFDELLCSLAAATASSGHTERHRDIVERGSASGNGGADLPIRHRVADADVHGCPALAIADTIEDALRRDLVLADRRDRHALKFRRAECGERRVVGANPLDYGPFVVAVGEIVLRLRLARYSRNCTALARFGAFFATPPPEMLMCVPQVAWLGQTKPTLDTTSLSFGLARTAAGAASSRYWSARRRIRRRPRP